MKFRLTISKRLVLQLMLFTALTGVAMLFDIYFENHPGALKVLKESNEENRKEPGIVYLISQNPSLSVKAPVQNTPGRKFVAQAYSKYIQQCHQLRHHQAFKAEKKVSRKPVYLSCHNLLFRQNYFTLPDDEPLNS